MKIEIISQKSFDKIIYALVIENCSCIPLSAAKARELISAGVPVRKEDDNA